MSTGRTFKRGAVWWIQYSVSGRQYRESAKTTRKEDAAALLRERQREIWEGRFFAGARQRAQKTVGQLRDLWLEEKKSKRSVGMDKYRLDAFVEKIGEHRMLSTITTDDIVAFIGTLGSSEPSTRNRYRAALRGAFNLATDRDIAHRDPMRGVKLEPEDNARNRICSHDEYLRLRNAATGDLRALIVVGYWLGMRISEIANLERRQLDLDAGTIRLTAADTKERAIKTLPVPSEAVEELRALPTYLSGRVFQYQSPFYTRAFSALCDEQKVKDLRFHDLRHTALTRMGEAGVDIFTMQAFSGHKTLAMLKRYVHASPRKMKAAMADIESYASKSEASKR